MILALKGIFPAREHLDPASYAKASGVEDRDIPRFLLSVAFSQVQMTFERMRREFSEGSLIQRDDVPPKYGVQSLSSKYSSTNSCMRMSASFKMRSFSSARFITSGSSEYSSSPNDTT